MIGATRRLGLIAASTASGPTPMVRAMPSWIGVAWGSTVTTTAPQSAPPMVPIKRSTAAFSEPPPKDLVLALNRLSSALYLMTVKYLAGRFGEPPAGPVKGWKPPKEPSKIPLKPTKS